MRTSISLVQRYKGTVGRGTAWDTESGTVHAYKDGSGLTVCGVTVGTSRKGWEHIGTGFVSDVDCKRCLKKLKNEELS